MRSPLHTLLDGFIDYAGLFPPSKLPIDDAVRNYVAYVSGSEKWLVSRFVVPASRLNELKTILESIGKTPHMPISVLGTGGADLDALETALESDAAAMTAFEKAFGDDVPIEAFEIRVPKPDDTASLCRDLKSFNHIEAYIEVPFVEGMVDALGEIAETEWIGAKGRTGGLEPSAIPSSGILSLFLKNCIDLDLDFKLTAGLHEPVRHFDASIGADVHGFLNVLAASALHLERNLSLEELIAILDDSDPASFKLTPEGISWKGETASLESIDDLRSRFLSIGSCSVSEPLEGLAQLGMLEVAR